MSEIIFYAFGVFMGVTWAFSTVTEGQFTKAQEMCEANGGIGEYISSSVGYPSITCKNGAKFTVKVEDK